MYSLSISICSQFTTLHCYVQTTSALTHQNCAHQCSAFLCFLAEICLISYFYYQVPRILLVLFWINFNNKKWRFGVCTGAQWPNDFPTISLWNDFLMNRQNGKIFSKYAVKNDHYWQTQIKYARIETNKHAMYGRYILNYNFRLIHGST